MKFNYGHFKTKFQSNNENLYALPRTPVLTLEDEVDFCSASQMRKSHSIDTSYLYEEAQSTFAEAVNPKISANQGLASAASDSHGRHAGGSTNLCKSKSEFNLAFASPSRSGDISLLSCIRKKQIINFFVVSILFSMIFYVFDKRNLRYSEERLRNNNQTEISCATWQH